MDLTSIKLVATDMDGTLLNGRHELNQAFFPLLQQMKAKGILFAAASGRQYYNLLNRFEQVPDDVIFIAENGSYVVHQGKVILVQAMDSSITKELIVSARKLKDVHIILCGVKQAYVESNEPLFMEKVAMYYDKYLLVDDLLQVNDDQFLKIALCDLAGSETNSYPYFKHLEDQLQVKVSGSIWLDLSHRLNALQSRFGIPKEATMTFGDYLNDLELMQEAHFSFAMENAHPNIKKASNYATKSNEEDGVLLVLLEMLAAMEASTSRNQLPTTSQ